MVGLRDLLEHPQRAGHTLDQVGGLRPHDDSMAAANGACNGNQHLKTTRVPRPDRKRTMAVCRSCHSGRGTRSHEVYDPCCREKGISVVDMGLVRSVRVHHGAARVELLLTSGWCPFAAPVLTQVRSASSSSPGSPTADVEIVWDEAWTTDRLSPGAGTSSASCPAPPRCPTGTGTSPPHARKGVTAMIDDVFVFDSVAHVFNFE